MLLILSHINLTYAKWPMIHLQYDNTANPYDYGIKSLQATGYK